jgi:protein SCO1/2
MNKVILVVFSLAALITGIFTFKHLTKVPMPEHSLYYQKPRAVKPFTLTDHQGQSFTVDNLKGKWSWVFFGYTSCPDVCPTTLQELNFIYDDLKAASPDTQVLLVSVDPQRDSQQILSEYIAYFNAEFKALRGDHGVLFPFARNLGLMYAIADDSSQENYLVDHSASIVLINPEGLISAVFKPKQVLGEIPVIEPEHVVSDFQRIVALYN